MEQNRSESGPSHAACLSSVTRQAAASTVASHELASTIYVQLICSRDIPPSPSERTCDASLAAAAACSTASFIRHPCCFRNACLLPYRHHTSHLMSCACRATAPSQGVASSVGSAKPGRKSVIARCAGPKNAGAPIEGRQALPRRAAQLAPPPVAACQSFNEPLDGHPAENALISAAVGAMTEGLRLLGVG